MPTLVQLESYLNALVRAGLVIKSAFIFGVGEREEEYHFKFKILRRQFWKILAEQPENFTFFSTVTKFEKIYNVW